MAHAQLDVSFAVLWRERFVLPRRHVLVGLLTAPRRQGPPSSRVDPELIVDMIFGAMWYRLLVEHAPLDDALADGLARAATADLLDGCRS